MTDYQFEQCIGKGNFGDVWRARKGLEVVAVKVLDLEETVDDVEALIQETRFLSALRHKNIIRYHETLVKETTIWIVMELCGGGSCQDLLRYHKHLGEDVVAAIMSQVLCGLEYIHRERKLHRDIKLANILITTTGQVKLADFGVSAQITMTHAKQHTFVGTPYWMAPEVIMRLNQGYNEKADIWLLGITVIELAMGKPPHNDIPPMRAIFAIPRNQPPRLEGNFSSNMKEFVTMALLRDEELRPLAHLLLQHPWITHRRRVNLAKVVHERLVHEGVKARTPRFVLQPVPENGIQWNFLVGPAGCDKDENVRARDAAPSPASLALDRSDGPAPGDAAKHHLPYDQLLVHCLQRVFERARAQATRHAVADLSRQIRRHEADHPGLSEAIVQEIYRFRP